ALLKSVTEEHPCQGHYHERRENRPALALIPYHSPERIRQSRGNYQEQKHLEQVGQRRGIFERMCRVDVEETAAIGAEQLDGFLGCHRPLRNRLLRALDGGDVGGGLEIL